MTFSTGTLSRSLQRAAKVNKSNLTKTRSHYMAGPIPPPTPSVRRTEHKVRDPQLGERRHKATEVFEFSTEHIAASLAPVFSPVSGPKTRGYEKRYEMFKEGLKNIQPIPPIRTGNPTVDDANMQRYKKQEDWFQEIGKKAARIFQYNLKYHNQPSRQFTLANNGGEGDSAMIRNRDIDASCLYRNKRKPL